MADVVEECVVHSELLVFIARNPVLQTHKHPASNLLFLITAAISALNTLRLNIHRRTTVHEY